MYERFVPVNNKDKGMYIQDKEGIIDLRSTLNVCNMLNVINENFLELKEENKQLKKRLLNAD